MQLLLSLIPCCIVGMMVAFAGASSGVVALLEPTRTGPASWGRLGVTLGCLLAGPLLWRAARLLGVAVDGDTTPMSTMIMSWWYLWWAGRA